MNRSIRRLYLTLAAGFGLLMLMLGYWQVVAADGLKDRPGNEQTAQAERLVDRGRIISADGKVMAASRAVRVKGQKVFQRLYPQGDLAAQTVGYTSEGAKTGIEETYDRYLSGSFGSGAAAAAPQPEREGGRERGDRPRHPRPGGRPGGPRRRPGRGGRARPAHGPRDRDGVGADLRPAARGGRLRRDPRRGRALLNRAVQGLYAPGSTFKVVTAAEALESGSFTPESEFPGGAEYDTPGGPIRNFGGASFGPHTLRPP